MATLRNIVTALFVGAIAVFLMVAHAAGAQKTKASPGIVFSAKAEPSSFSCKNTTCSGPAQFGFWIWCTSPTATSSGNCRGSMSFYEIGPSAVQVTGAVTVTGTTATVTVSSSATAATAVSCTLVNNSLFFGRNNTVTVTCDASSWTKPGPSGVSTTKADALVQISNRPNETSSLSRPGVLAREGEAGNSGRFAILSESHQRALARLTLISIDTETGPNATSRG